MSFEIVQFLVARVKKGYGCFRGDPLLDGVSVNGMPADEIAEERQSSSASSEPSVWDVQNDFTFPEDVTLVVYMGSMSPDNDGRGYEGGVAIEVEQLGNGAFEDEIADIVKLADEIDAENHRRIDGPQPEQTCLRTIVPTLWHYRVWQSYDGEWDSEIDMLGRINWDRLREIRVKKDIAK